MSSIAEMSRERLVALLYGPIETADDLAVLTQIAEEAGLYADMLIPATGEPGHDPRTGVVNPRAVYEVEEGLEEELGEVEPEADALWDPAPRAGEDLEATVTRRQAAADIAQEWTAEADLAADLLELALERPGRAASLAALLRGRGLLAAPAAGAELAEVA
ncbi:hypothetical protein HNR12_005653 [Streptomonospora nanhaiensis]|uniref:Uncharacterized protein n=1 Tax=Streptomonospora nanhaiensis TaxID=1323731 RepID=A0A853BTZ1_9ACTN|nr:hypothetical protein [Streptomonospora nanhaiensis]NYI99299.1 hypothetical protein [Streptomonospora nanhaiensis]